MNYTTSSKLNMVYQIKDNNKYNSSIIIKKQLSELVQQIAQIIEFIPEDASDILLENHNVSMRSHLVDAISIRQRRNKLFPKGLFAEPAWDILLDLALARIDGRRISVSSLCIAAFVPTTTALRWIKAMIDSGLIYRRADPDDGRRHYVFISDGCYNLVEMSLTGVSSQT